MNTEPVLKVNEEVTAVGGELVERNEWWRTKPLPAGKWIKQPEKEGNRRMRRAAWAINNGKGGFNWREKKQRLGNGERIEWKRK